MNHDELLTQATCAVLIKGQIVGTAWLVSDKGYLLTAGHVLGTEEPVNQVQVQFVSDVPRPAHRLKWMYHEASGLDFAVLKLVHPLYGRHPLPISLSKEVEGQFRLYGYGTTMREASQSNSEGKFLGKIRIGNSESHTLFRLHSPDLGIPGNSGGAVFSDELKAVVGIQTEAAKRKIGPESEVVLAMPLYRITPLLQALNLLAKKTIDTTPTPPLEPPLPKNTPLANPDGTLFAPWKRAWQSLTRLLRPSSPNKPILSEVDVTDNRHNAQQVPIKLAPLRAGVTLSEDGRVIGPETTWEVPLPKADPSFLQELTTPGAAVTLRDMLYVERDADAELKHQVIEMGSLTTIRAPHQTGKTSLFMRGIHHAHQHDIQVVLLDMKRIDRQTLQTYDEFLRYLANYIVWKLCIEVDVSQLWNGPLGSQDKLSILLEDYVLPASNKPLLLAIDDIDRLLATDFHTDFFGLLRSWHDSQSYQDILQKLNLLLVISTEPHLLIADVNQSPFNVGLRLNLRDFNEAQVCDLNQRHGSPVQENDIAELMTLLNGQPYLTRQALYTLVKQPSLTWNDLKRIAATEEGPFASHLRHYHSLIHDNQKLKTGLKQIIQQNKCHDQMIFYRLRRAGLVKGTRKACACRCDLYRIYFEDKL